MVDKNTVGSLTRAAELRLLEARSAIREPSWISPSPNYV